MRLPVAPDITETPLFNPSKDDFTYPMADIANIQHLYTLPSRRIVTFPKYIADHLAKHLAQKLALEEPATTHYEDRLSAQLKKIYVVI